MDKLRFLIVILFILARAVTADERHAPKKFYSKDFPNQQMGEKVNDELQATHSVSPPADYSEPAAVVKGSKDQEYADATDKAGPKEESVKVFAIGAILNSTEPTHYKDSLQELSEIALKFDLALSEIFTIGDIRHIQLDPGTNMKLLARGGTIGVHSEVPKKYPVKLSPTWIVKTEKGEVLLEAAGPLNKYFNDKGEFLLNKNWAEEVSGF